MFEKLFFDPIYRVQSLEDNLAWVQIRYLQTMSRMLKICDQTRVILAFCFNWTCLGVYGL